MKFTLTKLILLSHCCCAETSLAELCHFWRLCCVALPGDYILSSKLTELIKVEEQSRLCFLPNRGCQSALSTVLKVSTPWVETLEAKYDYTHRKATVTWHHDLPWALHLLGEKLLQGICSSCSSCSSLHCFLALFQTSKLTFPRQKTRNCSFKSGRLLTLTAPSH